jgi:formylglycine-generating enzyme required for sulfatase activity
VGWNQAVTYCQSVGGRLPSEAEWEYAARSRGQDIAYPWGNEEPCCARAIIDDGGSGCGTGLPWPVCSKETGNSTQNLCDMTGNLMEWVRDNWHGNYNGAPTGGSAWETGGNRLPRGGSFINGTGNKLLTTTGRGLYFGDTYQNTFIGFRCARDVR